MTFFIGSTIKLIATTEDTPTSITISIYDTTGIAKIENQAMTQTDTLQYTYYADTTNWAPDKYFAETTTTTGTYKTKTKKEFDLIGVV